MDGQLFLIKHLLILREQVKMFMQVTPAHLQLCFANCIWRARLYLRTSYFTRLPHLILSLLSHTRSWISLIRWLVQFGTCFFLLWLISFVNWLNVWYLSFILFLKSSFSWNSRFYTTSISGEAMISYAHELSLSRKLRSYRRPYF